MPDKCPTCKGERLLKLGLGTERLEDTIQRLFPTARLARLDRDTAASRQRLEEVLAAVQAGQVDILLGTQMVSKGHDFPKVTLVGVVQADAALNFPDFRAAERTFQLLTQVAGRAGRGELPGRVLVQTFDPENFAIKAALKHDCRAFWNRELAIREEVGYPPFTHLAMLRFEGEEETPASASAQKVAELLNRRIAASNLPAGFITILGPTPAPIARINGKYRYQLLIKCQKRAHVGKIISDIDGCVEKNVHLIVDIDPVDML
jgi:primosomal protein N' (replication factor Y)